MNDVGAHGSYFRRVLEESQRCAVELLERNNELRTVVVRLQAREQNLQARVEALSTAGEQARLLKARLLAVEAEARALREELEEARAAIERRTEDQERLHQLLSRVDEDDRRYGEELHTLQQQTSTLANLYVASYSLHSTLDRSRLLDVAKEIVANLIGSEEVAFFGVEGGGRLRLLDTAGLEPERCRELGAEGLIAAALEDGRPVILGPDSPRGRGEEDLTAVVPLRVGERVVAVIAIFRLLPQKRALGDLDRELMDLLASQAGMALHCAELHARLGSASAAP